MTLEEWVMRELGEFLFADEAAAVIELFKESPVGKPMSGRWGDAVAGHPRELMAGLKMGLSREALDWLEANKPSHFAIMYLRSALGVSQGDTTRLPVYENGPFLPPFMVDPDTAAAKVTMGIWRALKDMLSLIDEVVADGSVQLTRQQSVRLYSAQLLVDAAAEGGTSHSEEEAALGKLKAEYDELKAAIDALWGSVWNGGEGMVMPVDVWNEKIVPVYCRINREGKRQ